MLFLKNRKEKKKLDVNEFYSCKNRLHVVERDRDGGVQNQGRTPAVNAHTYFGVERTALLVLQHLVMF